ncbi:MAG: ABC transporter permease [Alphaproteobacteria bacterium]|nr:ABC transporter permease [Alphaproteobacteria bacterium]MCW5740127.1 ABC transporter permease [Alphaproteobacteria bacterium]
MSLFPTSTERTIAWRFLRSREREGFISFIAWFALIGVALGVATLIVVLSVMNGFRGDIFGRIIGMNGHIRASSAKGLLSDYEDLARQIATVPFVRSVTPIIERQAVVSGGGLTRGVQLRGMRVEDALQRSIIRQGIVGGDPQLFETEAGVIMGERLRQALGLSYGTTFTVITYSRNENGTLTARDVTYKVLASFLVKRWEFDLTLAIVPLDLIQDDFNIPRNAVTSIEIEVIDHQKHLAAVLKGLEDLGKRTGRDELRFADWRSLNSRLVGALEVERVLMFIILSLIVLVASMNVVASFTMLVRTKTPGIAILRTMGATSGGVVRIFFLASASVGTIGTILGGALGLLVCANMPAVTAVLSWATGGMDGGGSTWVANLPVRVDYWEVASVLLIALGLSLVAAMYPAWRAGRLEPVEALRHE